MAELFEIQMAPFSTYDFPNAGMAAMVPRQTLVHWILAIHGASGPAVGPAGLPQRRREPFSQAGSGSRCRGAPAFRSRREFPSSGIWEFVTAQNEALCQAKSARHGPTSEGHDSARVLWESERERVMGLFAAVELRGHCHRLAPFTNFNGNTFSAIAGILVRRLELAEDEEHLVRSLAGHIVAGAGEEEVRAFHEFCDALG